MHTHTHNIVGGYLGLIRELEFPWGPALGKLAAIVVDTPGAAKGIRAATRLLILTLTRTRFPDKQRERKKASFPMKTPNLLNHSDSRFIALAAARCGHAIFGEDVRELLVELHGPCFREAVPEDDADDGVRLVADVSLVVAIDHQEQLLLGLPADHPLCRGTSLACASLQPREDDLQDKDRSEGMM